MYSTIHVQCGRSRSVTVDLTRSSYSTSTYTKARMSCTNGNASGLDGLSGGPSKQVVVNIFYPKTRVGHKNVKCCLILILLQLTFLAESLEFHISLQIKAVLC